MVYQNYNNMQTILKLIEIVYLSMYLYRVCRNSIPNDVAKLFCAELLEPYKTLSKTSCLATLF